MDRPDSPPSPLHSPDSPPVSVQSRPHSKRSSKSSKDSLSRSSKDSSRSSKDRKSHLDSRSKELVRLLVHEENESHELRATIQVLSERVTSEALRADAAEDRARDAVLRFKQVNEARLAAQQDAARAHEELALYKLQLDNAQREIRRAQELLDALEIQRFEAEEAAARARSMARKLKEEKVVQMARDEGRIEGIKEGMARGRMMGYEEGRAEGYARARATSSRSGSREGSPPVIVPSSDMGLPPPNFMPPQDSTDTSIPQDYSGSHAERIVVHSPPAEPLHKTPPQDTEIHPVPLHTAPVSPQHVPLDFPPEGWIPTIEGDRIRLPPPHEMSPSPFSPRLTPSHTPPPTHALPPGGTPEPLMIPPPLHRVEPLNDGLTSSELADRARKLRRRRSSDSQSTTFSQFDLVAPPNAPSARAGAGSRILSAIVEESTPVASPAYIPATTPRIPSPVTMPTPEAPIPILPHAPPENYYRRPASASSRASSVRPIPVRDQSHLLASSPKGSEASSYRFAVEPPSRPESSRSGLYPAEQGMLSATDAERTPGPVLPPPEPPVPIRIADGELPSGFVPMGGPKPGPSAPQNPGATPAMYAMYTPPAAGGDAPPQTEPVVVPASAEGGAKRYSRTALHFDSSTEDSNSRPLSADSSSSSSSSSSMDSFTTPPQRRRPLATPAYAAAPTPPGVTYPLPQRPPSPRTSSAARVPLPPSTVGSPPMSTVTAARVPLPASSVGSPRSTYTRMSRRTGAASTSPVMVPNRGLDA